MKKAAAKPAPHSPRGVPLKIKVSESRIDRDTFVLSLIKRNGAKQIGAGKFGSVFAVPGADRVIKVCRDEAYYAFVAQVLRHQGNPWFPIIYTATEYRPRTEDPYLVVVMERLRKGTPKEIAGALCLFDNDRFKDVTAMMRILGMEDIERLRQLRVVKRALVRLYKHYGPDFHAGNVMFRGDQAVITDPVVSAGITTTQCLTNDLQSVPLDQVLSDYVDTLSGLE